VVLVSEIVLRRKLGITAMGDNRIVAHMGFVLTERPFNSACDCDSDAEPRLNLLHHLI
jgi:hypothetical protein